MSESKYKKGKPIKNLRKLVKELGKGRCVYMNDKVQNGWFIQNMTIRTILLTLQRKAFYYAKPK